MNQNILTYCRAEIDEIAERRFDKQLEAEYRFWLLARRCMVVRENDGSNQCQPPSVWKSLVRRIAAKSL